MIPIWNCRWYKQWYKKRTLLISRQNLLIFDHGEPKETSINEPNKAYWEVTDRKWPDPYNLIWLCKYNLNKFFYYICTDCHRQFIITNNHGMIILSFYNAHNGEKKYLWIKLGPKVSSQFSGFCYVFLVNVGTLSKKDL